MKFSYFLFIAVALLVAFVQFSEATPILENKNPENFVNQLSKDKEIKQNCQLNGGPCNTADECCGKRCNFYAHKCTI